MTDHFEAAANEVIAACERSLRRSNWSVTVLFDEWARERLYAELHHAGEDGAARLLDSSRSGYAEAVYTTAAQHVEVADG